ncbi:MAG: M20/M25/M40 family metallo-hydrolase [Planctomycetota bacterium]
MPLSEWESRVCREIESRSDALLDDLRRHVGLPTGGYNGPAIEETRGLLTDRLVALGATHEREAGDAKEAWLGSNTYVPETSVCGRRRSGVRSTLITGHMDTVHDPAGAFRELSVAPDGKTATGPGCVDMKGGLVIAVAALEALEACGVGCSWTFLLNADEETGTYHSERAMRRVSAEHDFGIALEPALADGSLAVERMGSGQFVLVAEGRAAHVGRAFEKGVSAVTALAKAIVAAGEIPEPSRGKILSIGPVEGGVATNAVPDRARAWGNVRFRDEAVMAELVEQVEGLAAAGDERHGSVGVLRSFNRPPKPLIPETERLALAARSAAEDLGQSLPFASTGGVCDGNIMQDAGLPTIDTLGVRGGGLHTPDEWIELASLVERCQLLAVLIGRISEGRVSDGRVSGEQVSGDEGG